MKSICVVFDLRLAKNLSSDIKNMPWVVSQDQQFSLARKIPFFGTRLRTIDLKRVSDSLSQIIITQTVILMTYSINYSTCSSNHKYHDVMTSRRMLLYLNRQTTALWDASGRLLYTIQMLYKLRFYISWTFNTQS